MSKSLIDEMKAELLKRSKFPNADSLEHDALNHINTLESENARLKEEVERLRRDEGALWKAECATYKEEVEHLKNEVERLKPEVSERDKMIEFLKKDSVVFGKWKTADGTSVNLQRYIEWLHSQYETFKAEIERLKENGRMILIPEDLEIDDGTHVLLWDDRRCVFDIGIVNDIDWLDYTHYKIIEPPKEKE